VELSAYNEIILTLGAGGYTGELLGSNKVLDYGVNALSTCFQFPYDWRRSIPENAARLDHFVAGGAAVRASARRGTRRG
jgi:hypothetical protein